MDDRPSVTEHIKEVSMKWMDQTSFDHVKVGPTAVLTLHNL